MTNLVGATLVATAGKKMLDITDMGIKVVENEMLGIEIVSPFAVILEEQEESVFAPDYIQIGILFIMASSFVLTLRQIIIQNKLFKAQLLRDIHQQYWLIYSPPTEEMVTELELYPESYMIRRDYEDKYKSDRTKIKRYLSLLRVYEYLALTHKVRSFGLSAKDLWSQDKWKKDLWAFDEFRDVHAACRAYYPEFADSLDELLGNRFPSSRATKP